MNNTGYIHNVIWQGKYRVKGERHFKSPFHIDQFSSLSLSLPKILLFIYTCPVHVVISHIPCTLQTNLITCYILYKYIHEKKLQNIL